MQQGNFIDVVLALCVSGAYAHYQEHWMLSCSIWFSAPSFWMDGGLETHAAALKTTTHPKTWCRKPYAATQHLMLLMMGVRARTRRAKNRSIILPSSIELAFNIISDE